MNYLVGEKRVKRIKEVLLRKQKDLRIFLDRVKNYHNASAIVRTADAVGVLYVYYTYEGYLPINEGISLGAEKWVEIIKVEDARSFLSNLREKGFSIYVTFLGENTVDYRDVDYTQKTLLVFGNEKEGVSEEILEYATAFIKIPMLGMVRSLNVSVSAGIVLYEAMRQREKAGLYSKPSLSQEEIGSYLKKWTIDRVLRRR